MPKGKWADNFIMNLHTEHESYTTKQVITDSAQDYVDWYNVKKLNRFSNRPSEYHRYTELKEGPFFQFGVLSRITVNDKLFIFAHGSPTHVGPYTAADLAEKLARWGLRQAGLITFKCCYVGKANFLEFFVRECAPLGIDVGWVKGYTGPAATDKKWFSKPKELITRDPG